MIGSIDYERYRAMLQEQIAQSLKKTDIRKPANIKLKKSNNSWKDTLDHRLTDLLATDAINKHLVHPPKSASLGWHPDYALSLFRFVKSNDDNPASLAQKAAHALNDVQDFSRIEALGPYLNIRISDKVLLDNIIEIIHQGDAFGSLADVAGRIAIVEYSSPNVAKPFGVNHLRSTVIGESLARFFAAIGYTVIRDNHLGDWGTQFGNLLAACDEFAPNREFASFSMDELTALYVRFSQEKKDSHRLVRKGQEYFARLESGDKELLDRWAVAFELSLKEFSNMYKRLNVTFDTTLGEAYFVQDSNTLINELQDIVPSDIVVFDNDTPAVYINAEHPVVIRTQDGYGVYAARDLATIRFRQRTYNPDIVIYVVGDEQSSYFRSLFTVAESAGLNRKLDTSETKLEHVNFGLLLDKSGKKLSTRKGTSGKLEDVLDLLSERTAQEVRGRNPGMNERDVQDTANKIAIGALIWNDLRTDRTSSVRFDIDRMLELGGGTVIDALYSYTRTCSILNKVKITNSNFSLDKFPDTFSTEAEHMLALRMSEFEDVVRRTARARSPHIFVMYLQELIQTHGRFYEDSRVTGIDDAQLADLRIALHCAYKIVMENGLRLLNIPIVDRL